jgi:DnaD/phage-associated family protein
MTTAPDALPVHEEFFRLLLPRIRDLAELKAVLYVAYLSGREANGAVSINALMAPPILRDIAGLESPEPAEERLKAGLDRAVADGTLLRLIRRSGGGVEVQFLLGTAENARSVRRLAQGDDEAARSLSVEDGAEVTVYRPNVYALYERAIGPLTPLVAERLRDAERSYPRLWIEQALDEAVHYNRRNWRYIEAILARWEEIGGPDGISK